MSDDNLWGIIPSEDGMDDYCWHLVGLGQEFLDALPDDPGPARRVAEDTYVESFRYVFDEAYRHYDEERYREVLTRRFAPKPLANTPNVTPNTVVVLEDGLLAIVIRVDEGSLFVATPAGNRTVPRRR